MENNTGSSFIPKRSTGKVAPVRVSRRIYIFSYIAYALFFGTLLSVVGIFVLERQAQAQLDGAVDGVANEKQAFDVEKVAEVHKLDLQLRTAKEILDTHAAPSRIFEELESTVVPYMQIDGFAYTRETGQPATISLNGVTDSFDVLLFQRQVIAESDLLANAKLTTVSYGRAEEVAEGASTEQTLITFTFEDESTEGIAYQPRTLTTGEAVFEISDAETDAEAEVGVAEESADESLIGDSQ